MLIWSLYVTSTLHASPPSSQWGRYYLAPCFIDEEPEQRNVGLSSVTAGGQQSRELQVLDPCSEPATVGKQPSILTLHFSIAHLRSNYDRELT